ncbi:MAG: SpoIIE family protein phosphatase, partial [Betaproteobacteria bacterium]
MTKKGYGIPNIARKLNHKIHQLFPMERFVAAVLVAINFTERTIEVWSGGMPTAYFVDEHGEILREWRSAHPPLGILEDIEFQAKTETFHWNKPGQLLLYSDGLVEAENADGERFGTDRLAKALAGKGCEAQFPHLVDAVNTFMGQANAADDISVAAIRCPLDFAGKVIVQPNHLATLPVEPSESKLAIKLCAAELKSFDVLPWLISWLNQLYFSPRQCQELFLVLSELYNNALDHGILGLESSLKSEADGFGRYLDLREERLAGLQHGIIEIELERIQENQAPYLKMQVRDSGNGFASEPFMNAASSSRAMPAGRGIMLVKTLCAKLAYSDKGNEVVALYRLL